MTTPDERLRKAISEALAPQMADAQNYQANHSRSSNHPLPVVRADLHYIFDSFGTQHLDFSAAHAPVGYNHSAVMHAIKEHLDFYLRTASPGQQILRWPVEYAKEISESFQTPGEIPLQVLFTEGQREAVLHSINIARSVSGRDKIAMVDADVHNWVSAFNHVNIRLLPISEFWLNDFRWDDVGCLLLSLVTAQGVPLEPVWVQQIVDRAKQSGVPVIIDESVTGFGRTGELWGQQHYNVDADLTVLGGPVGGGMTLGAVVGTSNDFRQSHIDVSDQAGSPLACAAGCMTLRNVHPGVLEHVKDAGDSFDKALNGLIGQFAEHVTATYGVGLLRSLEFSSEELAHRFALDTRNYGLLVPMAQERAVTFTPPLIASENEIRRGVDLMAEVLMDWQERD